MLSGTVLAFALSENDREVIISTTRGGEPLHDLSWYDVGRLPLTLRAHDAQAEVLLVDGAAVLRCLHHHGGARVRVVLHAENQRAALPM